MSNSNIMNLPEELDEPPHYKRIRNNILNTIFIFFSNLLLTVIKLHHLIYYGRTKF